MKFIKYLLKRRLTKIGMSVGSFILQISQIICILVLVYIGISIMFDLNEGKGFKKGYFVICMYIIIRLLGYVLYDV